ASRNSTASTHKLRYDKPRLRIVSWNAGGLAARNYREITTWLQLEHEAHRTVDICVIQETSWKEDLEYTTSFEAAGQVNWHVVHSTNKDKSGILCMIRSGLISADKIRTSCLHPGRLLHVRLLFPVPFDLLCMYQHAWNLQGKALRGPSKTDALLRLRKQLWDSLDKWLSTVPQRHGCAVAGDFNLSVHEDPPTCGAGLPSSSTTPHPDQSVLMDILRAHRCCVLNTWHRKGVQNRTFLSPGADETQLGTQIDFIIGRGHTVDNLSKQAAAFNAPFVPDSGCRHRPLSAKLPMPRRPYHTPDSSKVTSHMVRRSLQDPDFAKHLQERIVPALQAATATSSIDTILESGWTSTKLHHGASRQHLGSGQAEDYEGTLSMDLSCATAITSAPDLACKQRKTNKVAEAVQSTDIRKAAKRFAPKDLNISTAEISAAFGRLRSGKDSIAPIKLQFDYYLTKGCQPICLLSLQAKLLASVVAGRLQPYVSKYLENLPQYAYVAHRTLAQALERVIGHCAEVRRLVQQQASTLHSRRQGSTSLSLYGGCQLSLDITSAYDHVPRSALRLALQDAGIPDNLIQAILLIHEQARIKIKHADQETLISLHRGLRQGCGLAPILWALYSGWVLKQMNDPTQLAVTDTATVYADDQRFAWTIRKGSDLEKAYNAMKHVLRSLSAYGLTVSTDKTVILLELKGSAAPKSLARHRLGIAKGTFTRAVYGQHFFMDSMLRAFRNLNFRLPEEAQNRRSGQ
ncbi:unnamed protein product, partial [Symbiodinium sp. CCMP2456]